MPDHDPVFESRPNIPSALDHFHEILGPAGRRLSIFLDYDGTLTPIVERPELALLSASTRDAVQALASYATIVILSGRDLEDVHARVGVDGIIYAGSHGFDIIGPGGLRKRVATDFLPGLDSAEKELRTKIADISGVLIERKRFSIAVHYRQVNQNHLEAVTRATTEVATRYSELRILPGKKVYEVQPNVGWNKGRAAIWLIEKLGLDQAGGLLLYIGDDQTDEEAFRALGQSGTSVIVTDQPQPTAAHFALSSPGEVERFLREIIRFASGPHNAQYSADR